VALAGYLIEYDQVRSSSARGRVSPPDTTSDPVRSARAELAADLCQD